MRRSEAVYIRVVDCSGAALVEPFERWFACTIGVCKIRLLTGTGSDAETKRELSECGLDDSVHRASAAKATGRAERSTNTVVVRS